MSLLNNDNQPTKLIEGMLNTASAATRRIATRYIKDPNMMTPLEFLIDVFNDSDVHIRHRITAAKTAMPFMHQQLPNVVEVSGRDGGPIELDLLATDAHRALESVLVGTVIEGEVEGPAGVPAIGEGSNCASLLSGNMARNTPNTNLDNLVHTGSDIVHTGHDRNKAHKRFETVPSTVQDPGPQIVAKEFNSNKNVSSDANSTSTNNRGKEVLKRAKKEMQKEKEKK